MTPALATTFLPFGVSFAISISISVVFGGGAVAVVSVVGAPATFPAGFAVGGGIAGHFAVVVLVVRRSRK